LAPLDVLPFVTSSAFYLSRRVFNLFFINVFGLVGGEPPLLFSQIIPRPVYLIRKLALPIKMVWRDLLLLPPPCAVCKREHQSVVSPPCVIWCQSRTGEALFLSTLLLLALPHTSSLFNPPLSPPPFVNFEGGFFFLKNHCKTRPCSPRIKAVAGFRFVSRPPLPPLFLSSFPSPL